MKVKNRDQYFWIAALSTVFLTIIVMAIYLVCLRGWGFADGQKTRIVNVTADIFGMAMGFMLFVCCVVDFSRDSLSQRFFVLLVLVDFFAMFFDELAWLVDGMAEHATINLVVNTFYYISTPMTAYLFWKYVVAFLKLEDSRVKFWQYVFDIGIILEVIIILLNIPFGFYFTIDSDGVYSRAGFYICSLLYTYFTLISTLVLIIRARKRLKTYQVVILFLYAMLPFCAGIVQMFFYGLSITSQVTMLVFLLMYCVLNVMQNRDRMIADRELGMASAIQENVLPRIFPPFPNRREFELYASMKPAKVVGGDFYDFFLIDDDHLALVIADVSGKGVPAALFMMVAKTLIKNQTLADSSNIADIFTKVNRQLCEGNSADMFVTVWMGILELSSGRLRYSNAGHEDPAICRKEEDFELHKEKHSLPLAAFDDTQYEEDTLVLRPGDTMFTYTDGIPEATNSDEELFGTKRMLDALNMGRGKRTDEIDQIVRKSIEVFQEDAPQFDDITILSFRYLGRVADDLEG